MITGQVLDDSEISTYYEVLGKRAYFTTQELKLTKCLLLLNNKEKEKESVGGGSLVLQYFMSIEELSVEHNISTPYFIFPDNNSVKGSSVVFNALLEDMHRKKLVAIGSFR